MKRFNIKTAGRTLMLAGIAAAAVWLTGCASSGKAIKWSGAPEHGMFKDDRDGTTYRTVTFGNQKWLAENLRYAPTSEKTWCYGDNPDNCEKYGRLYKWGTAKSACPPGWHLPSKGEWDDLSAAAGISKLKSGEEWTGTDDYGFAALPGGKRYGAVTGYSKDIGRNGYWWSSSQRVKPDDFILLFLWVDVYQLKLEPNGGRWEATGKGNACSVRCVQD